MKYTIFGRMIDGDETLDAIEKVLIDPKTFRPTTEIKLRRCTIHANPIADLEDWFFHEINWTADQWCYYLSCLNCNSVVMIDCHAHIGAKEFDDIRDVLVKEAKDAGVIGVIV